MRTFTGILFATLMTISLGACRQEPAEKLSMRWGVVTNHLDAGFLSRLVLSNDGSRPLGSDWTIYFNFLRRIDESSVTSPLNIEHVNGDLYRMTPAVEFGELARGDSVVVEFMSGAWAVSDTDGPAGAYIVFASSPDDPHAVEIEIEPFVTEAQTDRGVDDNRPVTTPELEYARNLALSLIPASDVIPITPTPAIFEPVEGEVRLSDGLMVSAPPELRTEADLLIARLSDFVGVTAVVAEESEGQEAAIRLKMEESTDAALTGDVAEGYSLTVDPASGIDVIGKSPAGVFYGAQSLVALIDPKYLGAGEAAVPAVRVVDRPRFAYRGMHLDVSRNFQPEEAVLKLLDLMSFYKLNKFHFHLTDDEGWRLAIAGLPELTEVGAYRGHTTAEQDHLVPSFGSGPDPDPAVSHGSGFYDRDGFLRILRYATERHIEVIPEIDVPGHARAAIVSMKARHDRLMQEGDEAGARRYLLRHPDDASIYRSVQGWNDNVIDVCMPSTYQFLRHVVAELVEMYEEAGAPLTTIHTGGDEVPRGVWEQSPACGELRAAEADVHLPSLFLDRISDIISEHGLVTAGWEEVALRMDDSEDHAGKVPDPARLEKGILPYVWNSIWGAGSEELAYRLANAGFDIVLSSASNLYFDLAYDKHPEEPGYYWAGYVDLRKPFELEPLDLYRSGKEDLLGNPIDPAIYADSEPLTRAGGSRILGIQGQLWGENAKSVELMDYLAFPRLIVLAERAWARQPEWSMAGSVADRNAGLAEAWNEFANRLGQQELARLSHAFGKVSFRIPPPGAVVEDGSLKANVALPGLVVRYTTDGSIPNLESTLYEGPVDVTSPVHLMTFDASGRGSRVVHIDVGQ